MKKVMLFAAAAIAASVSITSAQAGPGGPGIGKVGGIGPGGGINLPGGGFGGSKPGCCGGWTGNKGWGGGGWGGGFAGGVSIGLVSNVGGDCYYVRRNVLVPGIGFVSKRQLVCE